MNPFQPFNLQNVMNSQSHPPTLRTLLTSILISIKESPRQEYKQIIEKNLSELEKHVNKWTGVGWKVSGGVTVVGYDSTNCETTYCQVLTLNKNS